MNRKLGLLIALAFCAAGAQTSVSPSATEAENIALEAAAKNTNGDSRKYLEALEQHLNNYPESSYSLLIARKQAEIALSLRDAGLLKRYAERLLQAKLLDVLTINLIASTLNEMGDGNASLQIAAKCEERLNSDDTNLLLISGYAERFEKMSPDQRKLRLMNSLNSDIMFVKARALSTLEKPIESMAAASKSFEYAPNVGACELIEFLGRRGKVRWEGSREWVWTASTIEPNLPVVCISGVIGWNSPESTPAPLAVSPDRIARRLSADSARLAQIFASAMAPSSHAWPLHPDSDEDFLQVIVGEVRIPGKNPGSGINLKRSRLSARSGNFVVEIRIGDDPGSSGALQFTPAISINANSNSLELSGIVQWTFITSQKVDSVDIVMPNVPAQVIGQIRFPAAAWTPIRDGLKIKGGGLRFEVGGVSLLPGTQISRSE